MAATISFVSLLLLSPVLVTGASTECPGEEELVKELAEAKLLLKNAFEEVQSLEDATHDWTQRLLNQAKAQFLNDGEDRAVEMDIPPPPGTQDTTCINQEHFRLLNGSGPQEGLLEVKVGDEWMTVCETSLTTTAARLICAMLGYPVENPAPVGNKVFGDSNRQVLPGSDSCSNDAGIICEGMENYPVRLVNGSSQHEGNVEIRVNGKWGIVCDNSWESREAQVVCRMLGYNNGRGTPTVNSMFGRSNGPQWSYGFECDGSESTLLTCVRDGSYYRLGYHSGCSSTDAAGVICEDFHNYPIRLVNGSTPYEGAVEMKVNGQWKSIYDSSWGTDEAVVVCRQLGYTGSGAKAMYNSAFHSSITTTDLGYFNCHGDERHLAECAMSYALNYSSYNTRNDAAGVICQP